VTDCLMLVMLLVLLQVVSKDCFQENRQDKTRLDFNDINTYEYPL